MVESSPIYTQIQPNDVLQNAKYILARYQTFSGDAYLTNMSNLFATVGIINSTDIIRTQGNMKLEITASGGTVTFLWMYTTGRH